MGLASGRFNSDPSSNFNSENFFDPGITTPFKPDIHLRHSPAMPSKGSAAASL